MKTFWITKHLFGRGIYTISIDLNSDQARWLHFALGQLLLRRENYDLFSRHGVTDDEANLLADQIRRDTNEMRMRKTSRALVPPEFDCAAEPSSVERKP